MKKAKLLAIVLIVAILAISQSALVSAAPSFDEADSISGGIYSVSVSTDDTGMTVIEITLIDAATGEHTTVRVTEETAYGLGLVDYDDDGNPVPVDAELWPESITVPLDDVLPTEEQAHHPVGNALAAFFGDLPGVDYNVIMAAHQEGYGFGVIAQALWLTQKMEGDADILIAILEAKKTGDYSAFALEDGTILTSWGQFKKAINDGDKKNNLGVIMSGKDKDKEKDKEKDKDKEKEKDKNNGSGSGSENGNAGNNDNNKDKDKGSNVNNGNKDKEKNKP